MGTGKIGKKHFLKRGAESFCGFGGPIFVKVPNDKFHWNSVTSGWWNVNEVAAELHSRVEFAFLRGRVADLLRLLNFRPRKSKKIALRFLLAWKKNVDIRFGN